MGRFTVRTIHGTTHTAATGSRAREFADFRFLDRVDLGAVMDQDGPDWDIEGQEPIPEWQDHMHDKPEVYILPRIPRVIEEAHRQGDLAPMHKAYLESGLASRVLRKLLEP